MQKTGRNWESTCGDCAHRSGGICEVAFKKAEADDPIAAVCRAFESKAEPQPDGETARRSCE